MTAASECSDPAGQSGVPGEAFLTISVDDGHPTDFRTAKLLADLNLQATFYIPAHNRERPVLPAPGIRRLSQRFEVGAHTLNPVTLTSLPLDVARSEIRDGKAWLEDVIGQRVGAFCYPRGKFNAATVRLVRDAGYSGARSC